MLQRARIPVDARSCPEHNVRSIAQYQAYQRCQADLLLSSEHLRREEFAHGWSELYHAV